MNPKKNHYNPYAPDFEEDVEDEDTEEMDPREREKVVLNRNMRNRPKRRRKKPKIPESIRYLPPITMFD